jgi:hypothetical protein
MQEFGLVYVIVQLYARIVVIFSIKSLVVTNTKYPVLFYEGIVFV